MTILSPPRKQAVDALSSSSFPRYPARGQDTMLSTAMLTMSAQQLYHR